MQRPIQINMASPGIGSTPHVNGELFKVMTGTNLVHVPYRSAAAVMTDLLSGQVQLYFGTTASSLEYVRNGKLRAGGDHRAALGCAARHPDRG